MSRVGAIGEDVFRRLIESASDDERRSLLRSLVSGADAAEWLSQLKDESERYLTIDPRASLRLAESLIVGAELVDRPEHRAIGLLATGDALRALDRCLDALGAFDAAASVFQSLDDEVGWARSRIGRLWALQLLGRAADGLADGERARDILVGNGQWLRAGSLSLNLGLALSELGRLDEALGSYDRALSFYERARQTDPSLDETVEIRMARTYAMQARVLKSRGDSLGALTLHEKARGVFARFGDSLSVIREDQNIARVYTSQGHYTRALRLFTDALESLENRELQGDAGFAALELIECYLDVNLVDRAFDLGTITVARFEGVGMMTEAAKGRFLCALAAARRGEARRAFELLERAAEAFAKSGLRIELGLVALQRANMLLAEHDGASAVETARFARDLFADLRLVVPRCQAQLTWASALIATAKLEVAASAVREVLELSQLHDLPAFDPDSHRLLAAIAHQRGDEASALRELQSAIASTERIQGRLPAELGPHFLGDKAQVFHDAIDLCLRGGQTELAFAYLERAKSRVLVDFLNGNLDVRPPAPDASTNALRDELTRLRAEHNSRYDRRYSRGAIRRDDSDAANPALDDGSSESTQSEIRELERRIAWVMERLELRRGPVERVADQLTTNPVLPHLAPDTVLLEYFFGSERAAVFVVADGALRVINLTTRERDVRRLLKQWQLNLDACTVAVGKGQSLTGLTRNAVGTLASLYRTLILPVESFLQNGKRIVVIPYGVTHAVPFQALHTGERFLVEGHEISICPSSDLLRLCQNRRRDGHRSALVVACSDGGHLPAVLDEAREVAELFPGDSYVEERATLVNVTDAAPRHGVLHLAAHGEARLDNPSFAHLKLADGRLTPADIFGLNLGGALVTLSACETGRSVVAGGDELIGLSRGFLHAGAATLVQSMWRVDDGSTASLMGHFYRSLRAGRTKGAALREAQLALLESGASHPFLWAGFQMIGDSGHL